MPLTHAHSCMYCNRTWSCVVDMCLHDREVRPVASFHMCHEYQERIEALKALQRRQTDLCKHRCTPLCPHPKDVRGASYVAPALSHDEITRLSSALRVGHGNIDRPPRQTEPDRCLSCHHTIYDHDETDTCIVHTCPCKEYAQ